MIKGIYVRVVGVSELMLIKLDVQSVNWQRLTLAFLCKTLDYNPQSINWQSCQSFAR